MTIKIGTVTAPMNQVSKINPETFTFDTTLDGYLVEGTSLVDPDILIESATAPTGNYMYIPEFGRCYYMKSPESVKTNLWKVHGHVDVLTTYGAQIKANDAVIARNSNVFNLYLEDSRYKAYSDPHIITRVFPSGFHTFQFVLALLGGYDTSS